MINARAVRLRCAGQAVRSAGHYLRNRQALAWAFPSAARLCTLRQDSTPATPRAGRGPGGGLALLRQMRCPSRPITPANFVPATPRVPLLRASRWPPSPCSCVATRCLRRCRRGCPKRCPAWSCWMCRPAPAWTSAPSPPSRSSERWHCRCSGSRGAVSSDAARWCGRKPQLESEVQPGISLAWSPRILSRHWQGGQRPPCSALAGAPYCELPTAWRPPNP